MTALQALASPVRLWLHIPTQAAVMLLIGRRNPDICSTAALQHPAAQRAARHVYCGLSALLRLMPLRAAAVPPQHGPLGRCRAVLGLAELLLGFLAPTLVLAATESMLFQQYHRRWQQQQQQREELAAAEPSISSSQFGAGGSRGGTAAALKAPSRLAMRGYLGLLAGMPHEAADWMAAVLCCSLLLASAWQLILLLTPAD